MPTYGYRCGDCGHEFEIVQRISDEPLKTCPNCSGTLSKMVYPAGVIFTGSGYYTTDYKSSSVSTGGSNGSSSEAGSKADGKSESKPDGKSESKPETKSESKSDPKPAAKSTSSSDSKTEKAS